MTSQGGELAERLEAATKVARIAGALALDYYRQRDSLVVERKGKQDLVSRADKDVEALIRRELGHAFPGDEFLGEEGGGADARRTWVVDPIDGTFNYLRGVPCWGVVIAWVEQGRTLVGVTYDPVHDEMFTAREGHGAFRDGAPIRVATTERPDEGGIVGLTFNFKQPVEPYVDMVGGFIRQGFEHRRMGSTAVQLCWVADGRLDASATLDCASWDCLAGLVLVREAGGRALDFTERYGLLGKGGVIASAPGVAGAVEASSGLRL